MKVICSSARGCFDRNCHHRIIHESDHDMYSCTKIPCNIEEKPKVDFDIFCIQIKEI